MNLACAVSRYDLFTKWEMGIMANKTITSLETEKHGLVLAFGSAAHSGARSEVLITGTYE